MALESLVNREYRFESDVWMTGVAVWELFGDGNLPYASYTPAQVCVMVSRGHRLRAPLYGNEDLAQTLAECWRANPHERITLPALKTRLTNMLRSAEGSDTPLPRLDQSSWSSESEGGFQSVSENSPNGYDSICD